MNEGTLFVVNACHLLKCKGIKIGEFEKNIGVTKGYLSKCKSDNKRISLDLALRIAEALETNIYDIISIDTLQLRIDELETELKELKEKQHSHLSS